MIKNMSLAIITIWVFGVFAHSIGDLYQQKVQCIEDNGFLKGWLFCDSESSTPVFITFLGNFFWPVSVFRASEANSTELQQTYAPLTREQIGKLRSATAFTCLKAARKLAIEEDINVFDFSVNGILKQEFKSSSIKQRKQIYLQLEGFAEDQVAKLDNTLDLYYDSQCAQAAISIRQQM